MKYAFQVNQDTAGNFNTLRVDVNKIQFYEARRMATRYDVDVAVESKEGKVLVRTHQALPTMHGVEITPLFALKLLARAYVNGERSETLSAEDTLNFITRVIGQAVFVWKGDPITTVVKLSGVTLGEKLPGSSIMVVTRDKRRFKIKHEVILNASAKSDPHEEPYLYKTTAEEASVELLKYQFYASNLFRIEKTYSMLKPLVSIDELVDEYEALSKLSKKDE